MYATQSVTRAFLCLAASAALLFGSARAENPTSSADGESGLIAILRSDAPPAEKATVCKQLAIVGSSEAVPELAKLLPDPQLSSWARIALEAIPGPEADRALRDAAESLDGKLLVGMINSIGVRRDSQAVDTLASHLQSGDGDVASAAAVALGRIGNEAATETLRQALAKAPENVRSAVAEGCVLVAEALLAADNAEAAAEIYDEVRAADVPQQRVVEATRGSILARNQEGIPLLLETFRSPSPELFQLALSTIREFPGDEVDPILAAEIDRATPHRAALLIQAMADRKDTVVLAALLEAAGQGDKQVRLSAIDALSRVGDPSCLAMLLRCATDGDADLATAAKETLAEVPGSEVDAKIVALLPEASGDELVLLLELIGQRRIGATEDLVGALDDSNAAVRRAALYALGETVTLDNLALVIAPVIDPKHPQDRAAAVQALKAASVRMPDRETCANLLTAAMNRAPAKTQGTFLEVLAAVGGRNALETLATAAKSDDPQQQDTSSRLLGKWNSVDAAPTLLDLAKSAPAEKYRIRALRGYIGIARKFPMPEPQRVEMCRQAFETATRTAEQQLVLDVLKVHPSAPALELANEAKQISDLRDEATAAAQFIEQKLSET